MNNKEFAQISNKITLTKAVLPIKQVRCGQVWTTKTEVRERKYSI